MLASSLDALLKLSKTTCPQKLFANDCVTLYYLTFRRWRRAELIRSNRNRFVGDVILGIVNMAFGDKASI